MYIFKTSKPNRSSQQGYSQKHLSLDRSVKLKRIKRRCITKYGIIINPPNNAIMWCRKWSSSSVKCKKRF